MTVTARTGDKTPVANIRASIDNAIESALSEIHTSIPGVIVAYDPDTQLATVQVSVKRLGRDGTAYTVPPIQNVPVWFPRSAVGAISWKLAVNDPVLLIFSERPLDEWRQAGGLVDAAQTKRFHAYTDAIAIPGLYPDSSPVSYDSDNDRDGICIQTADAKILIGSDGKVRIGKRGASPDEPVVLGTQLLNYLSAMHSAIEAVYQALITGPIGVGNLGAPVPTSPTVVASLTTQLAAVVAARTQYVDTAATNVVSQRTFADRGV